MNSKKEATVEYMGRNTVLIKVLISMYYTTVLPIIYPNPYPS